MTAPTPEPPTGSETVTCYHCLLPIDWGSQQPLRYDPEQDKIVKIPSLTETSSQAWARNTRNAIIRCPNTPPAHYLPYEYGRHGQPVVIGFVGEAASGKSHLISAMIQAIGSGELQRYGLSHRWVDSLLHKRFVDNSIRPLFGDNVPLHRTDMGRVNFADAFVAQQSGAAPRVVALFDVSGEELASVEEGGQFLFIANALMFLADPAIFGAKGASRLGDRAFTAVLDLLPTAQLERIASVVVLSKADLLRFDSPVDMWLQRPIGLDPLAVLEESRDVYAYLQSRGAHAWNRPYHLASRATLHVVSATGGDAIGGRYVRGVNPQRVLGPLLAALAMTGVISTPESPAIGT